MKNLIVIFFTLLSTWASAQELKIAPEAFVRRAHSKPAPPINLMHKIPPVPVAIKINKPTLIHFWATWCGPCIEELPSLVKASKAFNKSDIDVLIISVDTGASNKVPPFLAKHGMADTIVYWDARSDLYKKFGLQVLPSTIFLDSTGAEVGRINGAAKWRGELDVKFFREFLL